jgi:hypothetical protein
MDKIQRDSIKSRRTFQESIYRETPDVLAEVRQLTYRRSHLNFLTKITYFIALN